MNRIDCILQHQKFLEYIALNVEAEKDRIFCRHGLQHALDVAKAAFDMENGGNNTLKKDVVYAAGLLHDIGRWKEYGFGEDHALASSALAVEIIRDCGYNLKEEELILEAIENHRQKHENGQELADILYRSDKTVRPCVTCQARNQCKHFQHEKRGEPNG